MKCGGGELVSKTHFRGAYLIFSSLFFSFLFFFSLYLCLSLSDACGLQALHMFFCSCFFSSEAGGTRVVLSFYRQECCCEKKKNQLKDKRSPLPFNADMENLAKWRLYATSSRTLGLIQCCVIFFFFLQPLALSLSLSMSLCLWPDVTLCL